jgi:hypothetical protein
MVITWDEKPPPAAPVLVDAGDDELVDDDFDEPQLAIASTARHAKSAHTAYLITFSM